MNRIVIKVGGAFLDDLTLAKPLMETISALKKSHQIVLVHGGGNAVEKLLAELGQTSEKLDGLRVTPTSQIDYVVGALAGTVNKKLCALAKQNDLQPTGLSLADGDIAECQQISAQLGCVGRVSKAGGNLINALLNKGYFPIISSIGSNVDSEQIGGQLLNVNADQAATAIAKALSCELFLLSDVPGVLDAQKNLIPSLDSDSLDKLIIQSVIRDGMLIKVRAALDAANEIGLPVTIASWRNPNHLFADMNTVTTSKNSMSGTKITPFGKQETR